MAERRAKSVEDDADDGDAAGRDSARMLEAVYDELRQLAAARLAREKPGQTIQATALVHEAYLKLKDGPGRGRHEWDNRGHFFAAAAEAMRRILVDQARRKNAQKRGGKGSGEAHGASGGRQREDLHESRIVAPDDSVDVIALSEALDRLAEEDVNKAALVKLRHFAGLTIEQAAEALNISHATAERWWSYSRLRLFQWMTSDGDGGDSSHG